MVHSCLLTHQEHHLKRFENLVTLRPWLGERERALTTIPSASGENARLGAHGARTLDALYRCNDAFSRV
jgi:hypothetical protein